MNKLFAPILLSLCLSSFAHAQVPETEPYEGVIMGDLCRSALLFSPMVVLTQDGRELLKECREIRKEIRHARRADRRAKKLRESEISQNRGDESTRTTEHRSGIEAK